MLYKKLVIFVFIYFSISLPAFSAFAFTEQTQTFYECSSKNTGTYEAQLQEAANSVIACRSNLEELINYNLSLPTEPTYVYGPTVTDSYTVQEGDSLDLYLSESDGSIFSSVTFASYGTPTDYTLGECHAENSLAILQELLINKSYAHITASNELFGDPCYGTYKVLQFTTEETPTLPSDIIPPPSQIDTTPAEEALALSIETYNFLLANPPTPTPTPTTEPTPTPTPTEVTPTPTPTPTQSEITPTPTPEPTQEVVVPVPVPVPVLIPTQTPTPTPAPSIEPSNPPVEPPTTFIGESFTALSESITAVFDALKNIGSDLPPEVRDKAKKIVVGSIIVTQIAVASSALASVSASSSSKSNTTTRKKIKP